jgi:hypothetical protein
MDRTRASARGCAVCRRGIRLKSVTKGPNNRHNRTRANFIRFAESRYKFAALADRLSLDGSELNNTTDACIIFHLSRPVGIHPLEFICTYRMRVFGDIVSYMFCISRMTFLVGNGRPRWKRWLWTNFLPSPFRALTALRRWIMSLSRNRGFGQ